MRKPGNKLTKLDTIGFILMITGIVSFNNRPIIGNLVLAAGALIILYSLYTKKMKRSKSEDGVV